MSERIGYVGLGNLGVHLAMSLVKAGHDVVVTDLRRDLGDRLIEAGATWADTAAAVAGQSSVVFTCLPSPPAVDAVVCGTDGILEGFQRGGTWIDNSTNDRGETLRLAARCADAGVEMLECPVTGGVHKAAEGDITSWSEGSKVCSSGTATSWRQWAGRSCTWVRSAMPRSSR